MREKIILGLALALSAYLGGCERIADQLPLSGLKGYAACLKNGKKAAVVSQNGLKVFCLAKFQADLPRETPADGRAGLEECSPEPDFASPENLALERTCTKFSGLFSNDTTTEIITGLTVVITNTQTKKTESKTFANLWIEPNEVGTFTWALENPFKRKNWAAPKDTFEWQFTAVKGFKIEY